MSSSFRADGLEANVREGQLSGEALEAPTDRDFEVVRFGVGSSALPGQRERLPADALPEALAPLVRPARAGLSGSVLEEVADPLVQRARGSGGPGAADVDELLNRRYLALTDTYAAKPGWP